MEHKILMPLAVATALSWASHVAEGACGDNLLENGGFEWANPCSWLHASDGVPPAIDRDGGAHSGCSFMELTRSSSSAVSAIRQTVSDVSALEDQWIVLEFRATVDGDADNTFVSITTPTSGVDSGSLSESAGWVQYTLAVQVTSDITTDVTVRLQACGTLGDDVTLQLDTVSLRVCDDATPDALSGNDCGVAGQVEGITTPDPCCDGDVVPDEVVDFQDLLEVLAAWGESCAAGDADNDSDVNFEDVLVVIDNWGTCPGNGGPEPTSLEDVVECMELTTDDWDDFEEALDTGTSADQTNYICWIEHYYDVHCDGVCFCAPSCPDSDPFGGHP